MADLIARLYAKERQAADAVSKLKATGFADDSVAMLRPPAQATEEGAPPPAAPAPTNELGRQVAAAYGEQLAGGRYLVAVAAPFGRGALATSILDSAGPLAEALPQPATVATASSSASAGWTDGTPFSRALGLAVLSNDAAPLSKMMGLATKSVRRHFFVSELSGEAAPLSKAAGLATKSARTHFLTGELSNEATPLSSRLGRDVLSNDPTPLSSRLGFSVLSNDPAPLSSRLGLRVLSDKQ